MQIDKQKVIDLLTSRGETDQATQAQSDLPEQVDTDQHADQLGKLGVNPQDLTGEVGGMKDKLGL